MATRKPARKKVTTRRRPLRDALAKRLRERALREGADPKKVELVIKEMESERPLIDWLRNGGFEALFNLFMELIKLL